MPRWSFSPQVANAPPPGPLLALRSRPGRISFGSTFARDHPALTPKRIGPAARATSGIERSTRDAVISDRRVELLVGALSRRSIGSSDSRDRPNNGKRLG